MARSTGFFPAEKASLEVFPASASRVEITEGQGNPKLVGVAVPKWLRMHPMGAMDIFPLPSGEWCWPSNGPPHVCTGYFVGTNL